MFMGGALVGTSILGKSFIHFYRRAKLRNETMSQLGKIYKGGFGKEMTRREAILILGIG